MSSYQWCGTQSGVDAHIRDGEDCAYCKDWVKRGSPVITPESLAPKVAKVKPVKAKVKRARVVKEREHGTLPGYRQHRKYGEPVCDPCREAFNADKRAWREKKRANGELPPVACFPPRGVRVHGNRRGGQQHRRNNEPVCDECKVGERAELNASRAEKRAEASQ